MSSSLITPAAVYMPSLAIGEIDTRYMDCTPDLSPVGDTIPDIGKCSIVITRVDGNAMTANDLALANQGSYPPFLDATQLVPTFWYQAPILSIGVTYYLTLTVNKTTNNRLFIRTFIIYVAGQLG